MPKRGSGSFSELFLHRILNFVKALDSVQEENAFVTLAVQAGGSLILYYRGAHLFGMHPHTTHARLGIWIEPETADRKQLISTIADHSGHFEKRIQSPIDFIAQWRCGEDELKLIAAYVRNLPTDATSSVISDITHPRYFPGEVRQAALQAFIRGGSYCRGVGGKRHKLGTERIEFDHILPYSKGGASSALNIEVLCADCNRRKRDLAL